MHDELDYPEQNTTGCFAEAFAASISVRCAQPSYNLGEKANAPNALQVTA